MLADDNALVDREAAYRAGLGWYGKNANLLLPGEGSWFVLGLGRHRRAAGSPRPAGGRRLRHVPPLPRRLPDRRHRRPRRGRRPPLPGVAAAGRRARSRASTGWRSATASTAATTARRCARPTGAPTRVDAGPAGRAAARRPAVDLLDLLGATDDELLDRHGRWYVPRRDPATCGATPWSCSATSAIRPTPGVGATLRRALGRRRPMLRAHAVWAARRLGRDDLLAERPASPTTPIRSCEPSWRAPVDAAAPTRAPPTG